jgi:hypothetical protein
MYLTHARVTLKERSSLSLTLYGRKKETTSITIIKFSHLSINEVPCYSLKLLNNITIGVFLLFLLIVYDYELFNADSMFLFNIILT